MSGSHIVPLSMKNLAAYGLMGFPLAFAGLPVYLHAPDFYATVLGQSLTSLGLVLLALRIIDAVQDPLIGSLSDRFHGQRSIILVLGVIMLGAGFWMIFHPLESNPLTWFASAVFICTTGFSIVSINLQTLGGIWRASQNDRTKITSWREAFGLFGLLVAAISPTLLGSTINPAEGFHRLTLLYLPVLCLAAWLLLRWMTRADLQQSALSADGHTGWCQLLKSPWRRTFFGIITLNTFASAIPAVLVLFFIRDRLGAPEQSGLFLLVYFSAGILAMPIWLQLSKRFGKMRSWALSIALAIATFFWAAFLQTGQVEAYAIICALSGLALGADLALPPSILADHIAADKRQAEAGRLFACMTLLSKGALALATGLALPVLGIAGYQPGILMTADMDMTLSLAYAASPCILKILTLIWLLRQNQF
ncbi:MFS transporter [Roseibium algae]|uniref:MFS transporter n=1 Tax=Roseibium algae TaxID=3123038 RepID=A0ABU8TER3_9HYPH